MNGTVELGSVGMIYVPSFIKVGLGIEILMKRNIHTQEGDLIRLFLFFQKIGRNVG